MNKTVFDSPEWYKATTLNERLASLPLTNMNGIDETVAEKRLQRWLAQAPFDSNGYFAKRLAVTGITQDEFWHALGESITAVKERQKSVPAWLQKLAQAYQHAPETLDIQFSQELHEHKLVGFINAVTPLIQQTQKDLMAGVQQLAETEAYLPFNRDTVVKMLISHLPDQLIGPLLRTLILELNVAGLQGTLAANSTEERFEEFVLLLQEPDFVLNLFQEYPVMVRQLMIRIENWLTFNLGFLTHLCQDWEQIQTTFCPDGDPGLLIKVSGTGDRHRGGRSVLIVEFSSGFKLVYKPKPMAVDTHFQELLAWLNAQGATPSFRLLKVLNRGKYGWSEFITATSGTSEAGVRRFYERQGGYLALLYALEATDFHFENLIAAGEHPVLIDLESLFQPHVEGVNTKESNLTANEMLTYSVLRVGLLPQLIWANEEYSGIDMSGLGSVAGQLTPHKMPALEKIGTDKARFVRKRVTLTGGDNRPKLNGKEVDVLDYGDAIVTGFTHIYQLLLQHRTALLATDGLLARFANDEVRVILRATRSYATLLQESFHPDVLRNALDRERFLDRLWLGIEHRPFIASAIPHEQADLEQGDIPMFTTRPNSRHLWGHADEPIADFFDEPSMALVRRRLSQLSAADLKQQTWFIRASLTVLAMNTEPAEKPSYALTPNQRKASQMELITAVKAIGDRLENLAIWDEENVSWLGVGLNFNNQWSLSPLGPDLYDGLAGVVLFLAYLGDITQEKRYTNLARAALPTLHHQIKQNDDWDAIGFSGWGGIIYVLTHLAILWQDPNLLTEAEALVERLTPLIEEDQTFDVLNGTAGCIGGLLTLYHVAPSEQLLALLLQCGEHLLAHAQQMDTGMGWLVPGAGDLPLTGFAHGAAGIAWALLPLAERTDVDRFHQAALATIAYERSLFSSQMGNWPDLRKYYAPGEIRDKSKDYFMTAWCHGATGIGQARIQTLPYLDDADVWAEINTAVHATLASGFGGNHSLCHGDLGKLELFLQMAENTKQPQWQDKVRRIAALVLDSIETYGWLSGIPQAVETPGLMTGLAGIGYGFLRLVAPAHVPSILTMEPPIIESVSVNNYTPAATNLTSIN